MVSKFYLALHTFDDKYDGLCCHFLKIEFEFHQEGKRAERFGGSHQAIEALKAKLHTIQSIVLRINFPIVYGTPQMDSRIKS